MLADVICQIWKKLWDCEVDVMKYIKGAVIYILIGIGFGGLFYLYFLWQSGAETQTVQQIANVIFTSGLIGLVSMIFAVETIPMIWKIIIHFCLVYSINSWLNLLNGITTTFIWSWDFLVEFTLIYLVIWLVIYINFNHRVKNVCDFMRRGNNSLGIPFPCLYSSKIQAHLVLLFADCVCRHAKGLSHNVFPFLHLAGDYFSSCYLVVGNQIIPFTESSCSIKL